MERARNEFLHRLNVAKYRRLLGERPDAARHKMLITLLGEETAAAKVHGWSSDCE